MPLLEYYVRPTNGSDSNTGLSHAQAWQTLAYAVGHNARDTITDTAVRINVCDEAAHTVSAALNPNSLTTVPTIFQGYTSTAGDGGIGEISGGGSVSIVDTGADGLIFKDLYLHSTGSARIVHVDGWGIFENVRFADTSGNGLAADRYAMVSNCRFEDIGGIGVLTTDGGIVTGSFFLAGATTNRQFTKAMSMGSNTFSCHVIGNIFSLAPDTYGVDITGSSGSVTVHQKNISSNSIFYTGNSVAASAVRITNDQGAGTEVMILNNLIENAFLGVDLSASVFTTSGTGRSGAMVGGNSCFSCTTDIDDGDCLLNFRNDTLSATPFAKSGAVSFSNRLNYFEPVNIGYVFAPVNTHMIARGAVQISVSGTSLTANILNMPMLDNAANTAVDDTSAQNNNGVLSAGTSAAIRVTGPHLRILHALDFSSVYATITAFTLAEAVPRSISFWAKRTNTSTDDYVFGHSSGTSLIMFRSGANTLEIRDASDNFTTVSLGVTTTNWHHYAIVYGGSVSECFVDGLTIGEVEAVGELTFNRIARHGSTTAGCLMSNLKVYDYLLSPSQVYADYNAAIDPE